MSRPRFSCLFCGRDLPVARFAKSAHFESREEAEHFAGNLRPWQRAEITDRQRLRELNPAHPDYAHGKRFVVQYHDSFGGYGDNRFCGLNCGYHYAIDHTKTVGRSRSREVAA